MKSTRYSCQILMTFEFSRRISEKYSDRHDDFRNFEKASKKGDMFILHTTKGTLILPIVKNKIRSTFLPGYIYIYIYIY
jgi:hypothetical protein